MKKRRVRYPSAAGRTGLSVLVVAAFFLISAAGEEGGFWERFKAAFRDDKEAEPPPVEEVFEEAEELFIGRETWYGRLVKRTWGEDSRAYEKLPGVKRKNYPLARDLYQEVVDNYPFSKYATLAELRIGDCHYELEEYEEAAIWYGQFTKMHPRREEVPYATYMQGMCHFEQMLKPPRDQEQTMEALVLFETLRQRFPESPYTEEAGEKIKDCNDRLARHEMLVAQFYFKKRKYWAAAARYQGVWKGYPGVGMVDEAMYMEAYCYEQLGKENLARMAYERVAEKFPESDYAGRAKAGLEAVSRQESAIDEKAEKDDK
jgi:outer membrane protein assembly factor BamD